jgi:hypothetical protein
MVGSGPLLAAAAESEAAGPTVLMLRERTMFAAASRPARSGGDCGRFGGP